MMEWIFSTLVGLASAQVLLYKISARQAIRAYWFFAFFYFFIFLFVRGLELFSSFFSISFFDLSFLSLVLFIVFGRARKGLPRFEKRIQQIPDFFLLSSLWIGVVWLSFSPSQNLLTGFFWSLFAALMVPVLTGIHDRLGLADPPGEFHGLPIFLIATGILILTVHFFLQFSK